MSTLNNKTRTKYMDIDSDDDISEDGETCQFKVLIIDDNSPDGTSKIIEKQLVNKL